MDSKIMICGECLVKPATLWCGECIKSDKCYSCDKEMHLEKNKTGHKREVICYS